MIHRLDSDMLRPVYGHPADTIAMVAYWMAINRRERDHNLSRARFTDNQTRATYVTLARNRHKLVLQKQRELRKAIQEFRA